MWTQVIVHAQLSRSLYYHAPFTACFTECIKKKQPTPKSPPSIRVKKENQGAARTKLTLYNANSVHWHSRGSHSKWCCLGTIITCSPKSSPPIMQGERLGLPPEVKKWRISHPSMGLTLTLTWDGHSSGERGTLWSTVLPGTPLQANPDKVSKIFRNTQEWGTKAQAGDDGPLKPSPSSTPTFAHLCRRPQEGLSFPIHCGGITFPWPLPCLWLQGLE